MGVKGLETLCYIPLIIFICTTTTINDQLNKWRCSAQTCHWAFINQCIYSKPTSEHARDNTTIIICLLFTRSHHYRGQRSRDHWYNQSISRLRDTPGIGSRKCSLNQRIIDASAGKVRERYRMPSGVTVTTSWRVDFHGKYDSKNFPGYWREKLK